MNLAVAESQNCKYLLLVFRVLFIFICFQVLVSCLIVLRSQVVGFEKSFQGFIRQFWSRKCQSLILCGSSVISFGNLAAQPANLLSLNLHPCTLIFSKKNAAPLCLHF